MARQAHSPCHFLHFRSHFADLEESSEKDLYVCIAKIRGPKENPIIGKHIFARLYRQDITSCIVQSIIHSTE